MKQYKRSIRLSEQLLRDISSFFLAELNDGAPALITFTHVKLTDDLKYATIYYSCLGTDEQAGSSQNYLNKHKKTIRQHIGRNLHTRFIPEFTFKFDTSIAEGIKIEKLLNEINEDNK